METRVTDNSLLLDVESYILLRKATSKIISAGWDIVAEKHIQINHKIFRVKQPLINIICVKFISYN
jgi:hypothetical protein